MITILRKGYNNAVSPKSDNHKKGSLNVLTLQITALIMMSQINTYMSLGLLFNKTKLSAQ